MNGTEEVFVERKRPSFFNGGVWLFHRLKVKLPRSLILVTSLLSSESRLLSFQRGLARKHISPW